MKKLACFGSCCVDDYVSLEESHAYVGGGPLNSAIACLNQNIEVAFMSAIGNDLHAKHIISELEKHQIDFSHLQTYEGSTAISEVFLEEGDRRLGDYDEGVMSKFDLTQDDLGYLIQFDLCLTDFWGNQQKHFSRMKEMGIKIVLDGADHIEECLEYLPNLEMIFFSGKEINETFLKQLHEKGPKIVIETLGDQGSVLYHEGGLIHAPIQPVENVVDTLGAGDHFIGGFLSGYLNGYSLEDCLKKGSQSAAKALTYHGGFEQEGYIWKKSS